MSKFVLFIEMFSLKLNFSAMPITRNVITFLLISNFLLLLQYFFIGFSVAMSQRAVPVTASNTRDYETSQWLTYNHLLHLNPQALKRLQGRTIFTSGIRVFLMENYAPRNVCKAQMILYTKFCLHTKKKNSLENQLETSFWWCRSLFS